MGIPAATRSGGVASAGLALAGALVGAAYAISAYRLGAEAIPAMTAATVAVALGAWRLELGIAALVIATPFAENAPLNSLDLAPLRIALVAWIGALALLQIGRVVSGAATLSTPPAAGATLGLVAAWTIGVAFAGDQLAAASELLVLGSSVLLFLLIAVFCTNWERLRAIVFGILVSGLLVSTHAIWQQQTGQLSDAGFVTSTGEIEFRVISVFSSANQLAGYLVIVTAVALGSIQMFDGRQAKVFCATTALLTTAATLITFSRGALVALVLIPLVFIAARRAWPLALVVVALAAILAPATWQDRVAGIGEPSSPEIASRLDFWDSAILSFASDPITGVGLDSFDDAYRSQERVGKTFLGGTVFGVPETAHNLYLNTLAELGVVGALALGLLIVALTRVALELTRARSPRARAAGKMMAAAGIALAVHNFFDVTFTDPKTSILAWTVIGVGAAALTASRRGNRGFEVDPVSA